MSGFTQELIHSLFFSQFNDFGDNHDYIRFGKESESKTYKQKLKQGIYKIFQKLGFYRRSSLNQPNYSILDLWIEVLPQLEWLYDKLEDLESRKLLVNVIAYRIMGEKAIKLPLSSPSYWQQIQEFSKLQEGNDFVEIEFNNWQLPLYNLNKINFPVRLYVRPSGIMAQFVLQQYQSQRADINFEHGQVVLDCGGCYGDTALNFAHQVGSSGKVYTFEFVQSNLTILHKNFALNPELAERIEIIEHPLWSSSDIPMFVLDNGPASRVGFEPFNSEPSSAIITLSIDDLVERKQIERVDLIKMDIEGAEFEALKGAEKTICKFKPNLAISIYHFPEHFVQIPRFIDSLNLGYRFYLEHFTIHQEETVLFAKA